LAKKPPVSPEAAAQAEKMKARLEELAAKRAENESALKSGRNYGGGKGPGGVDPHQTRSGRRGNR
jgi:hypothetical protein